MHRRLSGRLDPSLSKQFISDNYESRYQPLTPYFTRIFYNDGLIYRHQAHDKDSWHKTAFINPGPWTSIVPDIGQMCSAFENCPLIDKLKPVFLKYPFHRYGFRTINIIHENLDPRPIDPFATSHSNCYEKVCLYCIRIKFRIRGMIVSPENPKVIGSFCPRYQMLTTSDWLHNHPQTELGMVHSVFHSLYRRKYITVLSPEDLALKDKDRYVSVTIGSDPEFEGMRDGNIVKAFNYTPGRHAYDPIGCDGTAEQLEIRPEPSVRPAAIVNNIRKLLQQATKYYDEISIAGDKYPLGGHIHFGIFPNRDLITMLDDFLGIQMIDLSGRARGIYKSMSSVRPQPHGFEYRTPPSSWLAKPEIAKIVLKIAKNLATYWANHKYICYDTPPTAEEYRRFAKLRPDEYEKFQRFLFDYHTKYEKELVAAWGLKGKQKEFLIELKGDWDSNVREFFISKIMETLKLGAPCKKQLKVVLFDLRGNQVSGFDFQGYNRIDISPQTLMSTLGTAIAYGIPEEIRMMTGLNALTITRFLDSLQVQLMKDILRRKAVKILESPPDRVPRPEPEPEPEPEPDRREVIGEERPREEAITTLHSPSSTITVDLGGLEPDIEPDLDEGLEEEEFEEEEEEEREEEDEDEEEI